MQNKIKIFVVALFAGLAWIAVEPAEAQAAPCDTNYYTDQFYACVFSGMSAPLDNSDAVRQFTEIFLPSPVGNWSGFNNNWVQGEVASSGLSDNVSIVWRGRINLQEGTYTFHTFSDDGIRLTIEGIGTVVENWTDHGPTQDNSAPVNLSAGWYNMTLQWYDNGWDAVAGLWWDFTPAAPTPVNDADYVTQSVPLSMTAGQSYPVSVTMLNTGNTTWSEASNYRLGSVGDDTTWSIWRVTLNNDVAPGNQYTFNFNVTAPATPNTYNFRWQMVQDGVQWFGETGPNTSINVSATVVPPAICGAATPDNDWTISTSGTRTVTLSGVSGASQVLFPTWTNANGQDDLIWWPGTDLGGGVWQANISLASHPDLGQIFTDVYAYNSAGTGTFCDGSHFTRLSSGTINVTTNQASTWTLTCNLSNPACPSETNSSATSFPSKPYATWTITPANIPGYDWTVNSCPVNTPCSAVFP